MALSGLTESGYMVMMRLNQAEQARARRIEAARLTLRYAAQIECYSCLACEMARETLEREGEAS